MAAEYIKSQRGANLRITFHLPEKSVMEKMLSALVFAPIEEVAYEKMTQDLPLFQAMVTGISKQKRTRYSTWITVHKSCK